MEIRRGDERRRLGWGGYYINLLFGLLMFMHCAGAANVSFFFLNSFVGYKDEPRQDMCACKSRYRLGQMLFMEEL